MNFQDEAYVRIYTRDSKTWLRWGWEGQAVFVLTMRRMAPLGRIEDIDNVWDDVALLTGLPLEVVRAGLPRLFASNTFVLESRVLECPNYIDGQTASKSDSLKSREYRARLKARRDTSRVARNTAGVESDTGRPVTTPDHAFPVPVPVPYQDPDPNLRAAAKDLTGSAPPPANDSSGTIPAKHNRIPDGWKPNQRTLVQAQELGFSVAETKEILAYARNQFWERAFLDPDRQVQQLLVRWRRVAESRKGRDAERGPRAVPAR